MTGRLRCLGPSRSTGSVEEVLWLWAVGPLVIVCVAVWLLIGARRLSRLGLTPDDDRPEPTSHRLTRLRENVSGLHDHLEHFGPIRMGDNDVGPADR